MKDIQEEFISTVSHELRTPLTSIRGFSQTLLSSWDKIDDTSKKKFIGIIEEQSNRLINLVENILTVSKLNADKPIFREVYVNSGIEKVVQLLALKYKKQNADDAKKQRFYDNILRVYNAALKFIKRSSEEALKCGKTEMAQGLLNLSENAPKNLYEAMQTTLIYYYMQHFFDGTYLRTLGRLDSLYYQFYKNKIPVSY